jgi:hypothetical protein
MNISKSACNGLCFIFVVIVVVFGFWINRSIPVVFEDAHTSECIAVWTPGVGVTGCINMPTRYIPQRVGPGTTIQKIVRTVQF